MNGLDELSQSCSGVCDVVSSCSDQVEAGADAVVLVLVEIELDRVSVVGKRRMKCLSSLTGRVQLVVLRHRSDQVCQTCLWRPPAHLGCTHVVCQAAVGQVVGA